MNKEEAKHRQQKLQSDLQSITNNLRHLESTNAELQRRAGDVRRALHNLELSEEQYAALKETREEETHTEGGHRGEWTLDLCH